MFNQGKVTINSLTSMYDNDRAFVEKGVEFLVAEGYITENNGYIRTTAKCSEFVNLGTPENCKRVLTEIYNIAINGNGKASTSQLRATERRVGVKAFYDSIGKLLACKFLYAERKYDNWFLYAVTNAGKERLYETGAVERPVAKTITHSPAWEYKQFMLKKLHDCCKQQEQNNKEGIVDEDLNTFIDGIREEFNLVPVEKPVEKPDADKQAIMDHIAFLQKQLEECKAEIAADEENGDYNDINEEVLKSLNEQIKVGYEILNSTK